MSDDKFQPNMERLQAELGRAPPRLPAGKPEDFAPKPIRDTMSELQGVMTQANEIRELSETLSEHIQDFFKRINGVETAESSRPMAATKSLAGLQEASVRNLNEAIKVMNQLESIFFGGSP